MTQISNIAAATPIPVALLVDDDPAIRAALSLVLELEDVWAVSAASLEEALSLIDGGLLPDVIVSDLHLAEASGLDAIRGARQAIRHSTPAVLMTGDVLMRQVDPNDLVDCVVMYKPLDPMRLAELVRELAAGRPA